MNIDLPKYTISNAAQLVGISVHTLRMYERQGLIIPYKKKSNQRLYSENDLHRIKCIRQTINEQKITIEGIRRFLSLIPCWGIKKCSNTERENCEAYATSTKPCWLHKHRNNICEINNCRECEVYNEIVDCNSIKEKLNFLID